MLSSFLIFIKNKIFIGVVALTLVFIGSYAIFQNQQKSTGPDFSNLPESKEPGIEYIVTMTDDGFVPDEITIYEGQTIKFITERNKSHWPASNFHPSHSIYSAFDPKKPIPSDESWSFTFDEVGEYRFHDHLFPSAQGVIYVLSPDGLFTEREYLDCSDEKNRSTSQCWDVLIQEGWRKGGIEGGFAVISDLYENEPEFLNDSCHRYAHVVGDLAFDMFYESRDNYENWDFPPESIACGYGFYHGLFEHVFREDKDLELAVNICDALTKKFSNDFPGIRRNCFHGIGHGFMPEAPPQEQWGKPLLMVKETLEVCDDVSEDFHEVSECYQGAYNVLADWVGFRNFELEADPDRPFWMCDAAENEEHKNACYYEFAMRVPSYVDYDLIALENKYLKDMEDDYLATLVIHSAAASVAEINMAKDDFIPFLLECRDLDERLHKNCLQGLTGGLVHHGEPQKEYIKAIDFCASNIMTSEEKDICYKNILIDLAKSYTDEQMKEVCNYTREDKYKDWCINESYHQQ